MKSLRFNPNLLLLTGIALLGALTLAPDSLGWLRATASAVFYPIAAPVRGMARRVDGRVATPRQTISHEEGGSKSTEQLQNELETLRSQFAVLQAANADLRRRLDDRKDWPVDMLKRCDVAAVASGEPGTRQVLSLQPGSPPNPVEGQPVVVGLDVVGKLKPVGLGVSKVILITDAGSSLVGAELTHTNEDGSGIEPLGLVCAPEGDGKGGLVVRNFKAADLERPDKSLKIKRGDNVIVHDGDWPKELQGFCVGEIEDVVTTAPLFRKIIIRPRRDLMKLREVMVWRK